MLSIKKSKVLLGTLRKKSGSFLYEIVLLSKGSQNLSFIEVLAIFFGPILLYQRLGLGTKSCYHQVEISVASTVGQPHTENIFLLEPAASVFRPSPEAEGQP